jgi:hypothetical protein
MSASSGQQGFLATARAVAWAFLGIRKRAGYEADVQGLNPLHVVLIGVLAAVLFVSGLALLVRWVLASGVAA